MERYFIFLYPNDPVVAEYLDLAVYLLNPREKWPAHVTVAGPFDSPKRFSIKRDLNEVVFALGTGNFFDSGSSTVFLKVDFLHRREVWKKPDFKGEAIPHLTLYDGNDREFASDLFLELKRSRPYFSFFSKKLEVIKSTPGQFISALRERVNMSRLEETSGLELDSVLLMTPAYRIELAVRALKELGRHQKFGGAPS